MLDVGKIHRKERGMVLPLVLLLLVMGSLLVIPTLDFGSTTLKREGLEEKKAHELYAADAGIQDALWHIHESTFTLPGDGDDPVQGSLNRTVNEKDVDWTVAHVQDPIYQITSTAQKAGSNTTVESYVEIVPGTDIFFGSAVTATGATLPTLEGSVVDGDIYVNGDVDLESANVTGNVYATGEVHAENATVSGNITGNGTAWNFTYLEPEDYKPNCATAISLSGMPYKVDEDTVWDKPVCVSGNLTIEEGVKLTLNGTVWVDGNIKVEGDWDNHVTFNGTGDLVSEAGNIWMEFVITDDMEGIPLIWAVNGDITVETNENECLRAFLYAPNGTIRLEKSSCVYGAVFAEEVVKLEDTILWYPEEWEMEEYAPHLGASITKMTYTVT